MDWEPITRAELDELLRAGLADADDAVLEAWKAMRIEPEKWKCSPIGDEGGGFWVVAVHKGNVTYYNDVEDGFNESPFTVQGVIDEYWCNQGDFKDYLKTLPIAQRAEHWEPSSGQREVPPELRGSGRINKRQTTYWTLADANGDTWRMHFRGKVELNFTASIFNDIILTQQHPLLQHYQEEWAGLYFKKSPKDPQQLLDRLKLAVVEHTNGWRRFEEYANKGAKLTDGFGLLLEGPRSLVEHLAKLLQEDGIGPSILPSVRGRESDLHVMILGSAYVIANEFRFVRGPHSYRGLGH